MFIFQSSASHALGRAGLLYSFSVNQKPWDCSIIRSRLGHVGAHHRRIFPSDGCLLTFAGLCPLETMLQAVQSG